MTDRRLPEDKMFHIVVSDRINDTEEDEYFGNEFVVEGTMVFIGDSEYQTHGYHFNLPPGWELETTIVDRDERYEFGHFRDSEETEENHG